MRARRAVRERVQILGGHLATSSTQREIYLALAELSGRSEPGAWGEGLTAYELRVFSQNGEDGIIDELVRRYGAPGRYFVEFGAASGTENCTAFLADVQGWRGLLIEGDPSVFRQLEERYHGNDRVATLQALVWPENVEDLFAQAGVPDEPDLLSIDVDGHDLWIWRALERYRARIVVIEYNSALGAEKSVVQPPQERDGWDGTDHFGASISALRALGREKGYHLAHTDLTGTNAFFVRDDLWNIRPFSSSVPIRATNYHLAGIRHKEDRRDRRYVDFP